MFIGKAQEKRRCFEPSDGRMSATYFWLVRSTAMVLRLLRGSQLRPLLSEVRQLLPYTAKLCINGHEYAKQQPAKKNIGFQALDNGVLSCDAPKRLQASVMDCRRKRSMPYCANSCGCYHTPTPQLIAAPDIAARFPSSRLNSPSPKCWTASSPAAPFLRK